MFHMILIAPNICDILVMFGFLFVLRIAKLFNHNELDAIKDRKDKFKRWRLYNSTEKRITYFIGVLRFVLFLHHKFVCFTLLANCFARKLRKCLIQECQISQEMLVQCSGMRWCQLSYNVSLFKNLHSFIDYKFYPWWYSTKMD